MHGLYRWRVLRSERHGMLCSNHFQPRHTESHKQGKRDPTEDDEDRKAANCPRNAGARTAFGAHTAVHEATL